MIRLEAITRENLEEILALQVTPEQEPFLMPVSHALAKAWVYRDTAFPFAVYAGETPVGFVMLGYYEEKQQYTLWNLMIDCRYQGRGYGKAALRLALGWLKETFRPERVFLGVSFGNTAAAGLYRSFGFEPTGERSDTAEELMLKL